MYEKATISKVFERFGPVVKQKLLYHLVALFRAGKLRIPPKDIMWNSGAKFYTTKRKLYLKKWVVYAKKSFGGAEQVLEYLGRYTHRIAITNYRILQVTSTHVTFKYLDRKRKSTATEIITGE